MKRTKASMRTSISMKKRMVWDSCRTTKTVRAKAIYRAFPRVS